MKKYYLFSTLAIIAMMCMCMFTACGGDDNDDDLPDGYQKTTEGVHRIEVSVDGDLTGWEGRFAFVAVCGDGTRGYVKLYEDGRQISDDGSFLGEELRNYDIETDAITQTQCFCLRQTRDGHLKEFHQRSAQKDEGRGVHRLLQDDCVQF